MFRARLAEGSSAPEVTDHAEISELGWFSRQDLPLPISDFTIARIEDACADRPPRIAVVPPRTWLR